MKLLLVFASIVPVLCCSTPPARDADEWQGVGCVEEIEIPRYSAVARLALKTGTVRALIKIGKEGRLGDVTLDAPDPRLADEVRGWVKHTGRFLPSCAGREVTLLFTFRLEGEATHYPFAIVRFRPPNHFIIISQPRLPVIDYGPVPPRKQGEKRGEP
jgi:hypothetical protein